MPNGSSKHSKPKPAEVAADTKKRLIPRVKSIHDRGCREPSTALQAALPPGAASRPFACHKADG